MKICRIIYDWPPPWDGLAPHPYELTVSQANLGHEITVLAGRWPSAGKLEVPDKVKVYTVFREPFQGTIAFTSSIAVFFKYLNWRRHNKDVDIIHSHGHFGIWIYAYRCFLQRFFPWAAELKTPLVVHFHNTVMGRWEKMKEAGKFIMPHSKFVSWPMAVLADKWAIKTAAACIFVSKDTAEEANKYYQVNLKRCFVVESGVNPARFIRIGEEERNKSRAELGFDTFDKVILNYGMMVERKNIHVLVDALSYLPIQYKLMLVGQWPDDAYTNVVDQIIETKRLSDRIVKIGYTPYPQIPIALQNADMMVLPSSWEGLPKVVVESLAIGLPCLVSGFSMKEEVKGVFYLPKLDPKEIADNILKILSKPVQVDTAKIIHEYSWDRRAKEIEGVYDFAKKNYLA